MSDATPPVPVTPDDQTLIARVLAGDTPAFSEIVRRYNQRMYRVVRAILRDEQEAEDAMQQAYLQAYAHLSQFAGRAAFSTWLTRIAIHEALARRRRRVEDAAASSLDEETMPAPSPTHDPEELAYGAEVKGLLEASIDTLPESYRLVFVCRDVEGLSTADTAASLEIGQEAVKTRLHRARALLRRELYERAGAASANAFTFLGVRCDTMVQRIMAGIVESGTGPV
jgi:RNA polymerase sigma-70 factor (ECF subfamily)